MNIINIDFEKIKERIDDYILCNNSDIYLSVDTTIRVNKPIVLMNNDTLNLLKTRSIYNIINNNNNVPMIFGCYVAIANWLSLGEVILK